MYCLDSAAVNFNGGSNKSAPSDSKEGSQRKSSTGKVKDTDGQKSSSGNTKTSKRVRILATEDQHMQRRRAINQRRKFEQRRQLRLIDWLKEVELKHKQSKHGKLIKHRDVLIELIKLENLFKLLKQFLDKIMLPIAKQNYDSTLLSTNCLNARKDLFKLRAAKEENNTELSSPSEENAIVVVEPVTRQATIKMEQQQLFVVTLGSQEGAFENVRMTYAGDHGQQIKQLIQSHLLRRTSMCCLAPGSVVCVVLKQWQ